jgi:hypothetical protein
MGVTATTTASFQLQYLVSLDTLFATQSLLLWMVVTFLCLMAFIFLAVFIIKARQYRRFQYVPEHAHDRNGERNKETRAQTQARRDTGVCEDNRWAWHVQY